MESYKSILLAVELNAKTDHVLLQRIEYLVAANEVQLHLVHAVENVMGYGAAYGVAIGVDVEEGLLTEAEKQMQKLGEKLGVAKEQQHVTVGAAREVVVQTANDIGADLIVVGSHGRHGWHLLLGSTANGVLHEAGCDVLAIRMKE